MWLPSARETEEERACKIEVTVFRSPKLRSGILLLLHVLFVRSVSPPDPATQGEEITQRFENEVAGITRAMLEIT